MSSSTGTNGEPVWASGDAPSIAASFNELSQFALARGGLFRGTTTQRNALSTAGHAEEGDHWYDTTIDALYLFNGTGWVRADKGVKYSRGFAQNNNYIVTTAWVNVPGLEVSLTGLQGSKLRLHVSGGLVNANSGANRTAGLRFVGGTTSAGATTVIGRADETHFVPLNSGASGESAVTRTELTSAITGAYVVKVEAKASLASAVTTRLTFEVDEVIQ